MFRMPRPLPFYARSTDGRIDDVKTRWKGRRIWTTHIPYLPTFTETHSGLVKHIRSWPSQLANQNHNSWPAWSAHAIARLGHLLPLFSIEVCAPGDAQTAGCKV